MENHHFSWENPLFLWPFSIAMLVHQRVNILNPYFPVVFVSPKTRNNGPGESAELLSFREEVMATTSVAISPCSTRKSDRAWSARRPGGLKDPKKAAKGVLPPWFRDVIHRFSNRCLEMVRCDPQIFQSSNFSGSFWDKMMVASGKKPNFKTLQWNICS